MRIVRAALAAIVAHAREADPDECCGVLLGVGDRIAVAVRGRNLEATSTRFHLDPRDHIEARRQARASHQDVIGFYHSHPRGAPYPSASDIAEWSYPDAASIIVGVREQVLEARVFRIVGGVVQELSLQEECDSQEDIAKLGIRA